MSKKYYTKDNMDYHWGSQTYTESDIGERYKKLRGILCNLWMIIDDIDTYGDMAKSDDKLFRSLVEKRQRQRYETGVTTDGYNIFLDGENLENDEPFQNTSTTIEQPEKENEVQ